MLRLFALFILLTVMAAAPAGSQTASVADPQWTRADVEELVAFIDGVAKEGLDPADYAPATLRAAIASGNAVAITNLATSIFFHLATDLAQGHVRGSHRIAWHIPDPPIDRSGQRALLAQALAGHRIGETLVSLLPIHPDYLALKAALATTPIQDRTTTEGIRANLERWRWMPRDLGRRYLLVNVPAFELQLVEDGRTVSRHRLIVGKTGTPTPQFSTRATGLILNPWWDVPQSIVAESIGRLVRTSPGTARARGYVWSGGSVRQRPGPGNALGQMKLVMPNPFTVYIHDTPSKTLFDEKVRAFSHGCIRTQDPFTLAAHLLARNPGWDRAAIDKTVAGRVSTKIDFVQPLPVYVAYFTAATDMSGAVVSYPDIYSRDKAVVAQLSDAGTSS